MHKIYQVIDGDSIKTLDLESDCACSVRLAFIDAPEFAQEVIGESSYKKLMALVEKHGDEVDLISHGEDRYDRKVAEVVFNSSGLNCNLEMINSGYAFVYDYYLEKALRENRITDQHYQSYLRSFSSAKKSKLGIWTAENIQNPSEYRRIQRLIEDEQRRVRCR